MKKTEHACPKQADLGRQMNEDVPTEERNTDMQLLKSRIPCTVKHTVAHFPVKPLISVETSMAKRCVMYADGFGLVTAYQDATGRAGV
ncbi:hypothetical protein GHT06_011949 [Daphnia sinensis]|uniref:Uncharacterized protein n=1 Tax=Daphnia sinensis TaxID=1820382 RepID=A0AAD5LEY9_9CRUS|nr:hypothetical protein GHT06_011949 [Daphnia sinensis]